MSNGSIGIQTVSAAAGLLFKSPLSAADKGDHAESGDASNAPQQSAPAEGTGIFVDQTA